MSDRRCAGDGDFVLLQAGQLRLLRRAAGCGRRATGRSASVGIAGPPIGGVLYGIGRAIPFAADTVSYAFSFLSLLAMRTPFQQERPASTVGIRRQLAEGFSFLWRQPFLRTTAFLYGVGNFTIPALLFVLVVVARRDGVTPGGIGVLLASFSACLLIGSLLSPLARRAFSVRAIMLAELYAGLATVAYVVHPNVYVLAAAMLPQAFVLPITDSVVIARRLAMTPDRLLGRVEAARTTIARTAQPLGPLVAGLLLGALSSRTTVALLAGISAALAVCGTASRALRTPPPLAEVV